MEIKNMRGAFGSDKIADDVIQWARDCGLLMQPQTDRQFLKLIEEVGETISAYNHLAPGSSFDDSKELIDGLGDCFVVLIVICAQLGWHPNWVISQAYNEIKNRKGQMFNGYFLKEKEDDIS